MTPDRFGNKAMLEKMDEAEPFFILRAQDPFAAFLVKQWAELAEGAAVNREKVLNARQCSHAMSRWLKKKIPD